MGGERVCQCLGGGSSRGRVLRLSAGASWGPGISVPCVLMLVWGKGPWLYFQSRLIVERGVRWFQYVPRGGQRRKHTHTQYGSDATIINDFLHCPKNTVAHLVTGINGA